MIRYRSLIDDLYKVDSGRKLTSIETISVISRHLSNVYICKLSFCGTTECDYVCIKKYGESFPLEKIQNEFLNNKYVYDGLSSDTNIVIPEPLFYDTDERIICTEYLANSFSYESKISPFDFLKKNKHKHYCYMLGSSLAHFHKNLIAQPMPTSTTAIDMSFFRDYLALRVDLIAEYVSETYSSTFTKLFDAGVVEKLDLFIEANTDEDDLLTFTHSDFTPANVLLIHNKFAYIDFSESKFSSKYMDIACFCNYLSMLKLNYQIYNNNTISDLIMAFKDGYKAQAKYNENALKIYSLRYLLTNTLSLIYESEKVLYKRILFKSRIRRYINLIINTTSS